MSYFGFLGLFLVIPIVGLAILLRKRPTSPGRWSAMGPPSAMAVTAAVAVLYTTPWDNYLVATGVWSYDPSLVSGVLLGYVPLEEYLFFVLQTVLTGSFLVLLARRSPGPEESPGGRLRLWSSVPVILLWLLACAALSLPWGPSRYSVLLFAWALPPVLIQLAFGADLLWRVRRTVLPAILAATVYYVAADTIAVSAGTWSFNPDLISGIHLGPLPIEEILFFLLTNVLIVFSVTLLLSRESPERFRDLRRRLGRSMNSGIEG